MGLFYLSFQRGPPVTVAPNELISVAPTIVNDLRDEIYQPEVEYGRVYIHLAWLKRHQEKWVVICNAGKISWEGPLSAYKPCHVKVPDTSLLRDCDTIRLALWATTEATKESEQRKRRKVEPDDVLRWIFDVAVSFSYEENQINFVPVLSAPIKVGLKNTYSNSSEKSSGMSRLFRIGGGKESAVVEICEESGYELDKHIWDASLHISHVMSKEVLFNKDGVGLLLSFLTHSKDELRIIELGAGTGLVTILLSAMLARRRSQLRHDESEKEEERFSRIHLTATDLASAIPLLEKNIATNSSTFSRCNIQVDCQPLDWLGDSNIKDDVDLILVSDCTYNITYFEPLCKTIHTLLGKGGKSAVCLLAKKHRHSDEEELWVQLQRSQLALTLVTGQHKVEEGRWGMWKLTIPCSTPV